MRTRLGLLIAAVFVTLLAPIQYQAQAVGGYASAPLSVGSTAIAGGLRVTWSVPTDVDTGITGYRVEYSTTGTSGTWTLAAITSASTYTYDILGLSQTATYVRVAATTNAGIGTYGYRWSEVYRTTSPKNNYLDTSINYVSGYGLAGGDAAAALNNTTNFTRVRYRMEATLSGVLDYADTDFYKWSGATISNLQVPVIDAGTSTFVVQTNVTDLNTYSSNARVTNAAGLSGRIEIWPYNYAPDNAGDYSYGDNVKYDYNDSHNGNGSYGTFQVHDITNFKTVFAWNLHAYGTGINNPDLGFGNNPQTGSTAMPDWTFCNENNASRGYCPAPTTFKLQVFINLAVTPLPDVTAPTVSRIDSRTIGKNGDTLTVRSNEMGTVYLVNQAVSVTNLASITAAASANKNSVSISAVNTNTVLTLTSLNSGLYNLYAADPSGNISTAILATINVDNTAPTADSIAVNSDGTRIVITASETITTSAFVSGMYSVSDIEGAYAVTAYIYSGNTITLLLIRAIPAGASVTFAYNPAAGAAAGRWIDQAGNEMAAITTRSITNNSSAPITVALAVADSISKGASITITASVSVAGKVSFAIAGKRIPGCLNKVATGSRPISVTCTFKPALSSRQTITATLVPTLGAYPTTVASVERFILKRSNRR